MEEELLLQFSIQVHFEDSRIKQRKLEILSYSI